MWPACCGAPRSPITNARTAPCAICEPMSIEWRRRSSASRYSGKLSQSHSMPSASAVPGMSSTPSINSISHCSLALGHRRETHAAIAGDDGGDAMTGRRVEHLVPRGLAVVVRVHVDEARRDDEPPRIDHLSCTEAVDAAATVVAAPSGRTSVTRPSVFVRRISVMRPPYERRREGRRARAVDDVPPVIKSSGFRVLIATSYAPSRARTQNPPPPRSVTQNESIRRVPRLRNGRCDPNAWPTDQANRPADGLGPELELPSQERPGRAPVSTPSRRTTTPLTIVAS